MPKKNMIIALLCFFTLGGFVDEAASQMYRYKDKNGVWHFTDTPTDKKFTRSQEDSQGSSPVTYHVNNPALETYANKLEYIMQAVITLQTKTVIGSGFLISPRGYAITNHHVIADGGSEIKATKKDGTVVYARVIHEDSEKDLALIKLAGEGYPFLPLAKTHEGLIGQEVYTVGAPLGLSHTVSKGIVSAIRTIPIRKPREISLIQTSAPIHKGNSGGPLVALNGSVLGVITLKVNTVEGIGFAVSTNDIISSLPLQEVISVSEDPKELR
jgi:S1-C subfamily serine protease